MFYISAADHKKKIKELQAQGYMVAVCKKCSGRLL
jgi:predicted nucleic-acid-binding Zn-ribbon protein